MSSVVQPSSNSVLWLALLLALAVRAWNVHGQSLSMDEHFEVNQTRLSVAAIVMASDGFPPLYQLLHAGWNRVTGDDGARWLSVLMGVALVAVIGRIGHAVGGPAVGRASAIVSALLPIHVWFSQEARAYSLVMLLTGLTIWATLVVLGVEKGDRSNLPKRPGGCSAQIGPVPFFHRWATLAATCVLGMYTHYYFGFVIALVGGYLMWSFRGRIGRAGWLSVGGGLLALVPLAWLLSQDLATQVGWPHKRHFGLTELGFTYFTFLSGFTLGPSFEELHQLSTAAAIRQFAPWLALASAAGILLVIGAVRRTALPSRLTHDVNDGLEGPSYEHSGLLVLLSAGTVVIGVACNVFDVGYQVRYAVWSSVPCAVVLGWLVARGITTWPGRIGSALLLILAGSALVHRHTEERYANPDVRSVAQFLTIHSPQNEPVFVISDYMVPVFDYYLTSPAQILDVPAATPDADRMAHLERQFNQAVPPSGRFWLLLCRDFHQDPRHEMRDWLFARADVLSTQAFAGATLIELRRNFTLRGPD